MLAADRPAGHCRAETRRRHRAAGDGGHRHLRHSGTPRACPPADSRTRPRSRPRPPRCWSTSSARATWSSSISVTSDERRPEPRGAGGRRRHRRAVAGLGPCGAGDVGMDRARRPPPRHWSARTARPGLIVAGITGGESDAQKYTKELTERLVHDRDGVTVRAGGAAMVYVQINGQSEKDLLLMESIAIPLSFLVLVWVFGGLLAAALPLAVGALRDPGFDGGAARDHVRHRRVDLRAQSERRHGSGAGHRLHAADRQPVPRRTRRRIARGTRR